MENAMLGVVLWSDASDGKAVIWCEDQGDLAYLNSKESAQKSGSFFDAGDLVQFDMEMRQSVRLANNPRLVIQKAGPQLAEVLREGARKPDPAPEDVKVIQFAPRQSLAAAVG